MATKHRRESYSGATVAAHFDNAAHTPTTDSLFRNVDSLAITTLLNPGVRKTVRDRVRYVVSNVPYAKSMLDTFVTHVVGPWASVAFPRGGIPETVREAVTDAFDEWAMATGFWGKVKTMLRAKIVDGEAFAMFTTDKTIVSTSNSVTLNVRPIECDRVESYTQMITRENEFDGIRFDENSHPTEYRILKYHPGDYRMIRNIQFKSGDWIKAANVIHYFDTIRPEQVRGISDFVSALDIPALQKSYRSAVAETAINAASVTAVLETDQVPECFDDDNTSIGRCAMDVKPNTAFQFRRGSILTMPEGWKAHQFNAEQPTSSYDSFVRSLIAEMAACLCMPVNIAMCDSSQHNFASAKLDHMTYGDKIAAVRADLSVDVLDRVFFAWLDEYAVRNRLDPRVVAALHKTEWLFTERANSDVMKDASADNTRLVNGTTTRATLYAKDGRDWKRETDQALDEYAYILRRWRERCAANGLPEDTPCPILAAGGVATAHAPTEDELEHDAEKKPQNNVAKPKTKTKTKKEND